MLITKEMLKVTDLDQVITDNVGLQLAVFAESYGLMYDRTTTFELVGEQQTLEITWSKNNLYLHTVDIRKQAIKFLKDVVFTFSKPVEESALANRKAICAECPLFDASSTKCRSCGCYMAVKWCYDKSTCPLNKWK